MIRMSRAIAGVAIAASLSAVGAASANAWTWGSSSNVISMTGGSGYGNLVSTSYSSGRMETWLRDSRLDGKRIYAHIYADYGNADFARSSGQRADGGTSYARMSDTNFYSSSPYGVQQYYYRVELCRSEPLADPCSDTKRYHSGL